MTVKIDTAYIAPLFQLQMAILQNKEVDVDKAVENMQPNTNVIVLGLMVFLLHNGLTPEQVIARFIANSK